MSTFSADEHARRFLADRVVDRSGEVQPAEVAVAVVADIGDVVLARHLPTERGGPLDEAVLVVVRLFVLAIAVVGKRHLRGEAEHREVLAIQVGDEHVVVAQALPEIVQSAVRVFLEAAKVRDVVLPAVVVARAEQPRTELVVLKQEAAEVRRERLDADAETVEVEVVGDVAQMLVDERRLDAEVMVVARRALARIGIHALQRFELDIVVAEHRREAELVVRRLEDGVALVIDELGREILDRCPLVGAAEHVDTRAIRRDARRPVSVPRAARKPCRR